MWNFKPEWWVASLVQEEKYKGKGNLWWEVMKIDNDDDDDDDDIVSVKITAISRICRLKF